MAKILLISFVLGFATCELIGAINYLPYSTASHIKDALFYPGALIAWPFYPEGVHTGGGAAYWGLVVYLGSVVFYVALWFALVSILRQRRIARRRRSLNSCDVRRHLGSAPPSPDTSVRFSHVNEEEVGCFYSSQQQYRAVISRDPAGRYRIRRERWNTGDWDIAEVAFWCSDDAMVTITDTLENARKLAAERLSEIPDASLKNDV